MDMTHEAYCFFFFVWGCGGYWGENGGVRVNTLLLIKIPLLTFKNKSSPFGLWCGD